MRAQFLIAREQVIKIAIQEPVLPNPLEHHVQIEPQVFHGHGGIGDFARRDVDELFEIRKQVLDDFILIAEVVIEVARGDVELICDVAGGDIGLAMRIE